MEKDARISIWRSGGHRDRIDEKFGISLTIIHTVEKGAFGFTPLVKGPQYLAQGEQYNIINGEDREAYDKALAQGMKMMDLAWEEISRR